MSIKYWTYESINQQIQQRKSRTQYFRAINVSWVYVSFVFIVVAYITAQLRCSGFSSITDSLSINCLVGL